MQEEDRVVILRFGHDHDPVCMQMDEVLSGCADKIKNFAVIYCVDISEVCSPVRQLWLPASLRIQMLARDLDAQSDRVPRSLQPSQSAARAPYCPMIAPRQQLGRKSAGHRLSSSAECGLRSKVWYYSTS